MKFGDLLRLLQSPIGALVSLALTITGLILAVYFFVKSVRHKRPRWAIRSNTLIEAYTAKYPGLHIEYKNQVVENLTVSRILLWNAGAETIRGNDIASADRLRIDGLGKAEILDAKLLQANNDANQLAVSVVNAKTALVEFEFLDRGQGGVIQVIHSGTSSKDVTLRGTIVGVGSPARREMTVYELLPLPTSREFDRKLRPKTRRIVAILWRALPILLLTGMFSWAVISDIQNPQALWSVSKIFASAGFLITLLIALALLAWEAWLSRVPRGLDAYEETLS